MAIVCRSSVRDNTLVYCGTPRRVDTDGEDISPVEDFSIRVSIATEVSRDVGITVRAGVRDRVLAFKLEIDLGVSVVVGLTLSLTGVDFLELLVLKVAPVGVESWVRGWYGDPVSGSIRLITVSGTSGGALADVSMARRVSCSC